MPRKKQQSRGIIGSTRSALRNTGARITEAKEKAENVVKEHPMTSIAVAAAVGALVALGISALVRRPHPSFLDRVRDYF